MKLFLRALIVLTLMLSVSRGYARVITPEDVENNLRQLDRELNIRDNYLSGKHMRIDSLRALLEKTPRGPLERVSLMEQLGREYSSCNNDSALHFFSTGLEEARAAGLDSMATALQLRHITFLPLAGFFHDGAETFSHIDTTGLSPRLMALYYDAGRQMYSYTSSYFADYPEVYRRLLDEATRLQLGLLGRLPHGSPLYRLNQGEYFYNTREYAKARAVLTDLLDSLPQSDNLYARAANILARVAHARGDRNEYLYYLSLSAIADVKGSTLEVSSLQELGKEMFDEGRVGRAHEYLSVAHANAVECHALLRVFESSQSMPLIHSAHNIELDRNRRMLMAILAVMVLLVAGLVVLLLVLRREMRDLNRMKEQLGEANHVKEIYISQFLNLCSIYMDKLNQFCKIAHRKISTGKVDDLYKLTKSGKFVEEQSREFYEVFDEAFLHIYPTFPADVNALLRPDGRIELKEGEKLNTDLRILAFMRLGIEESTRIAQVLNYSVYTIYTYRNKLKNRAIRRDTFEADVMKIGDIS